MRRKPLRQCIFSVLQTPNFHIASLLSKHARGAQDAEVFLNDQMNLTWVQSRAMPLLRGRHADFAPGP